MAFQQKPNTGSLFKNRDKGEETDRDYSGSLNIEGREFWISAYVRTSKAGAKYFALNVKPKQATAPDNTKSDAADLNDQIPF